ncbi:MAG: aminotransferase class IV [bacterium]|nr:aminotransferase class IV [bacterium]
MIKKKNAYDIIYTWHDKILEGTTFNFFIFRGNELITPKKDILQGTRRNLILKLAQDFKIAERPVNLIELKEATEAFISSTTRGIVPVV